MASLTVNDKVIALLKRYGYRYAVVERFNHHARIRQDFPYSQGGGFADVLAWKPISIRETLATFDGFDFKGVLAIQGCTDNNRQEHFDKIVHGEPYEHARDWLLAGNRFELWSFPRAAKKKRRVGRNSQLDVIVYRFSFDDQLYYEESTELECFGYLYRGRTR